MADSDIDNAHHVLRWVPKTKLRHDVDTNEVLGPLPIAFRLRTEIKESYLSISWVEHVEGSVDAQIKATAVALAAQVNTNPTAGGAFAVGNAGDIRVTSIAETKSKIQILSTPSKKKPAYGKVWGIEADNLTLQTALARGCWSKVFKAKDVL